MDDEDPKSLVGEGRAIIDGRKNKPLRWPQGVYDAILQLKAENPRRPINEDFLKIVNQKCKSGINVNGINSWWGRHQRQQREGSSGTSASPVQKEKKLKLKRKASRRDTSEDGEDTSEEKDAGNDSDDERVPKVNLNSSCFLKSVKVKRNPSTHSKG